jgi:hypothetical protein
MISATKGIKKMKTNLHFRGRSLCLRLSQLFVGTVSFILVANLFGDITEPIQGKVKDDLRPSFVLNKNRNWSVYVYFSSTRPIKEEWWLCVVSNRIGCQLRLWAEDGALIGSEHSAVDDAFHIAGKAKIPNLLQGIKHAPGPRMMPRLWIAPDAVTEVYSFSLAELFPMVANKSFTLEIAPMLYKADVNPQDLPSRDPVSDRITAHLVDFPPLYLKLLTNGAVISVDGPPAKEH